MPVPMGLSPTFPSADGVLNIRLQYSLYSIFALNLLYKYPFDCLHTGLMSDALKVYGRPGT